MAQDSAATTTETLESFIRFRFSEDGTRAMLDLFQGPTHAKLELEHFQNAFKAEGCDPNALNPELILEAADSWNKDHRPQEGVVVATSPHLPVPGKNGRFEFLVNLKGDAASKEASSKVDLRSVRALCAVVKDQPLMRKYPATKGQAGFDLHAKEIPAPDGKEVEFPMGELVVVSSQDPNVLVAKVAGYAEWSGGKLNVHDRFMVNGSVDYTTGNIDYARSVSITGDIQDGFSVKVGGDLEVGGLVSDAQVMVQGNVVVVGGIVGTGQGKLNAKGNVEVGFVSNQTVRSYQSITVGKESFNAKLFAKDQLIVKGPIVGGISMAGLRMECKALGNDLGTRTDIELGIDFLDFEHRLELDRKLAELAIVWQKIRLRMGKIKDAFQKTRKLAPQDAKQLMLLRGKAESISAIQPILEARKLEIAERVKQAYLRKGIEIKVEGKIYPGVLIKVENQTLRIPEAVSGPRYINYFEERIHMY